MEEERKRGRDCMCASFCVYVRLEEIGRTRESTGARAHAHEGERACKSTRAREREEKGAIEIECTISCNTVNIEIECTISCNTVNIKPRTHTTHIYTRTRTHTRAHTYDRMYHEAAGECVDRWGFACVCVRACACARVPCRCG